MRIGEAADYTGLTVDTIRFYMKKGLLIPERKGSHYYFSEVGLEDLLLIKKLKNMDFSLKEIHRILSLKRVSNFVDPEDVSDILSIYRKKRQELVKKRAALSDSISAVDEIMDRTTAECSPQPVETGLPLRAVSLLRCPECGKPPEIQNAKMNSKYITDGLVQCSCGRQMTIKDGILHTGNVNKSKWDEPDLTRELYKDLSSPLISLFTKSQDWMVKRMSAMDLENKVIMETHINAYFFLYLCVKRIPESAICIVTDKFPEMLAMYKKKIELWGIPLNILYIADSTENLPVSKGCVNLFVDFFGSNEHCFYHHYSLMDTLSWCFAPDAKILGTYFHYRHPSASVRQHCIDYPEAWEQNFHLGTYMESLKAAGFRMKDEESVGGTRNVGINLAFGFHQPDEWLMLHSFLAQR